MIIISSPNTLQLELKELKKQGKTIALVPTMGNLHRGHLSLISLAKQHADIVVASIFVNPMQFGPNEDFASYPRTLKDDVGKLQQQQTNYLFIPQNEDIYPLDKSLHTAVEVNRMTDRLCGASRPGHFKGVTTVVNILFNIVQPDIAIFGKKDFQQYLVIKAMVNDLFMPIQIIAAEIEREASGLAMSSRNAYLTDTERKQASQLRQTLVNAAQQAKQRLPHLTIIKSAIERLKSYGFTPDYFEILDRNTLKQATLETNEILIAAAAWMGKPRLIDNIEIDVAI